MKTYDALKKSSSFEWHKRFKVNEKSIKGSERTGYLITPLDS